MTFIRLSLPVAAMAFLLSACAAVSVVGSAASVMGTAVSTTADVAGSAVGAVTPDGDDDEDDD